MVAEVVVVGSTAATAHKTWKEDQESGCMPVPSLVHEDAGGRLARFRTEHMLATDADEEDERQLLPWLLLLLPLDSRCQSPVDVTPDATMARLAGDS